MEDQQVSGNPGGINVVGSNSTDFPSNILSVRLNPDTSSWLMQPRTPQEALIAHRGDYDSFVAFQESQRLDEQMGARYTVMHNPAHATGPFRIRRPEEINANSLSYRPEGALDDSYRQPSGIVFNYQRQGNSMRISGGSNLPSQPIDIQFRDNREPLASVSRSSVRYRMVPPPNSNQEHSNSIEPSGLVVSLSRHPPSYGERMEILEENSHDDDVVIVPNNEPEIEVVDVVIPHRPVNEIIHTNTAPVPSTSAAILDDDDNDDEGDSGSLCAICYSPYTNSGEHRLTCLKCGHLFGESCIRHWLRTGCQASNKRCPSCNSKASARDIRIIYAKNLVVLDTSEKDRLIQKLEKVQCEKNNAESQLNATNLKVDLLTAKLKEYEERIKELSTNNHHREQNIVSQRLSMFSSTMLSSFILCQDGGCRVLAYNSKLSLLLASQAAPAPLFSGYGIRKFNMVDLRPTTFYSIHRKSIRDMSFSPQESGSLLTVSLDCTAKLFDAQSNTVVQTFEAPVPLWSCTWSSINSNKFYCGGQNGTWFMYDKRHSRIEPEQVMETADPKDKSGILSLCHIPPRAGRFMPNGGVIACRLNNIVAYYPTGDTMTSKVLPIEGTFMSMNYNQSTDHVLVSTKVSSRWTTSRHMVCKLSEMKHGDNDTEGVDLLQTFYGSRFTNVLSKSAFVPFPNGDLSVCAYNSQNSNIDLWSVVSESKLEVNNVHLAEPVLDICSFQQNDNDVIIPCLSDKKLSVIKLNFDKNLQ